MQENITIARPYAGAVFELAQEKGDLQKWSTMLQVLALVVSDSHMQVVIDNPRIEDKQLTDIVIDICGEHLNEEGRNFVSILIDAGRLHIMPQIRRLYEEKKADSEGIAGVEVISAYPLEADQQEKIKQVMAQRLEKKIEITTQVDKTLIGGAVIRSGDSVIDASLRGRLRQLGYSFAE